MSANNFGAAHAVIFGIHYHPCNSLRCNGALRDCSEQYDCQPGAKLCPVCIIIEDGERDDRAEQRSAWRELDRAARTGVRVTSNSRLQPKGEEKEAAEAEED